MKTSVLSAALGALALAGSAFAAAPAPVAFQGFSYSGNDAVFETPLAPGQLRSPILAGFYPDPSICRVGDDYYLVNSTFSFFPGIPIFHSRDLANWTQLGHVIDRPTQLKYDGLGITRGIFAPALSHHDGTFYLVCTMVDSGGNFLLTAKNPAGPWSDPIWLDFDGIDPSLFFDDNGRAWLVNNGNPPDNQPLYQGHRAIWIQEFDIAAQKLVGPRSIIVNGGADITKKPVWIEGPHLIKRDGWYYLCCAEGGTSVQHSQVILRSKSPTGPFIPWANNPILTQRDLDGTQPGSVTCTGHADLTIGPDGNWWAVFLGCRPFAGEYWTTGRETFLLPVTWTADGWPQILPHGQRVPFAVTAPKLATPAQPAPVPLTGNFTLRDDFSAPTLSPLWIMLRTPHETWWRVDAAARQLLLDPRADLLSGKGNPSYLARRIQHARFTASVTVAVPATPGVSAGLAAFQNEAHSYYFAIRRDASGPVLFLERLNGHGPEILASEKVPAGATLELRVTGHDKLISFAYRESAGVDWVKFVSGADSTAISVQAAGGGLHFTGAVIGPHTRLEP